MAERYYSPGRFETLSESIIVNGLDEHDDGAFTLHFEVDATVSLDGKTLRFNGFQKLQYARPEIEKSG